MRSVAVFGGSFNPPHVAHVLAAAYVLAVEPVDEVLVVPAFDHPFGKALASFDHRLAMCKVAFSDLHRVAVSEIERDLGGESRTLYTLRALSAQHPDWSLRLVIGSDILRETHKWFGWNEVIQLAPPIVLDRVGFPRDGGSTSVLPEAASRDVRSSLHAGIDVSKLVPRAVLEYAVAHGLYREES